MERKNPRSTWRKMVDFIRRLLGFLVIQILLIVIAFSIAVGLYVSAEEHGLVAELLVLSGLTAGGIFFDYALPSFKKVMKDLYPLYESLLLSDGSKFTETSRELQPHIVMLALILFFSTAFGKHLGQNSGPYEVQFSTEESIVSVRDLSEDGEIVGNASVLRYK